MENPIKIFFAGDFCSKPSTSVISVSADLKSLISSCDIKFINFEVPLQPKNVQLPPQNRERFSQNDDSPSFLKALGFNLFSLANNHAFDWGEEGFKKTKAALGSGAFGAGTYVDAYKVKVVEINGIKIGFLAVCFAAYTGVFNDVTKHEGLGCAYINDLCVNHVILEAKKDLDFLFVLPHDGIEYIDIPLPETISRYRDFVDFGADGVIGTHPHCPQGWELYKGKPIFYSLGNFLFNSKDNYEFRANKPHWYEGLCVVLTIEKERISYQVINTRNVDNMSVIIDLEEKRNTHNNSICSLLKEERAYMHYLETICQNLGENEMTIIDRTIHPKSFKECARILLGLWKKKVMGRDYSNDYPLQRLLTHDARRNLLLWTIKLNNEL